MPGMPSLFAMDVVKTMLPPSRTRGASAWAAKKVPLTLILKVRSKDSSVTAARGSRAANPALRKRRSSLASEPKCDWILSGREVISERFWRSRERTWAVEPRSSAALVVVLRPVTTTVAPSSMRSWAVERPMPWVPPMIRTFLPVEDMVIF